MKSLVVTSLIIILTIVLFHRPLNSHAFEGNTHGYIASQAIMLFEHQYPSSMDEFNQYSGTICRWAVEADAWNYNEIVKLWALTPLAAKDHFWDADTGLPFCELGTQLSQLEQNCNLL